MIKIARKCLVLFLMVGILFSNVPYIVLNEFSTTLQDHFNIVDNLWKSKNDANVVDKFASLEKMANKFKIQEAKAATAGQMKLYFHKEPNSKSELYNSLNFTPPEPSAETAVTTPATNTFNSASPALCEASTNTGETYNKVTAANVSSAHEGCIASFISPAVGQNITISVGDTAPTASLYVVDSATAVTGSWKIYLYKWNGSTLAASNLIATMSSTTDPGTTVTLATWTSSAITAQSLVQTDRILAIATKTFTSAGTGTSSIKFDSNGTSGTALGTAFVTMKYSATTPNKPSLAGIKNDDFTTGAATTACSTAGVAYNTKWACLQGTAANTAGSFNAGNTAGTIGDTSDWLWLKNQINSTAGVASDFGATPSNTFLYQTLNAGYGDGVVRTVVNSNAAYTVGAGTPATPFNHTGLVLWTSNTDFIEIVLYSDGLKNNSTANTVKVGYINSAVSLTAIQSATGINSAVSNGLYNRVWLGFSKVGNTYTPQYSTDGTTWNNLGAGVAHTTAFTRTGLNAFTKIASPVTAYAGAFEWFQHTFASPNITVGTSGTQTTNIAIPSTGQYAGGALSLIRSAGTDNVTSISIYQTGSVTSTNLTNIKLFYDTTNCVRDGSEPQLGTTVSTFTANKATFGGLSLPVGTSQVCVYPVFDVGSGAAGGQTVEIQITNPSVDVVVSAASTVSPSSAVAIAGTTTLAASGSLSVDIVDASGITVASPASSFSGKTYNWGVQQSTATLGTASQKIRVNNATASGTWTLSIAATAGNTAVWTSGGNNYDFNSTSAAGRLQINPGTAVITPQSGCATTGLSLQTANYFAQGTLDAINIIVASSGAQTSCYWDITGVGMTQDIPASQNVGNYSLAMTLTAV